MSDLENEIARRNYALVAQTFDAEHFLQISCGGEVLVTITAETGPVFPDYFAVFNGDALDEEDNEVDVSEAVKIFRLEDEFDINDKWREAVKFGYNHALAKMMCADARSENSLSFA